MQKHNSVHLMSQISWKKQNKLLEQDAQDNIQLKKQINKQLDIDAIVQISINDKVYNLKTEATQLAKNLQNQKYKNLQLETIIKTIKIRMEDQKKQESSFNNDINNNENNQGLQRKIKKFEYDLTQLNTRANKISSIVTEGKRKISALRTERVIDSAIFRNIEKELALYELQFKKLCIDKIRHQKIYNQALNQYNGLKSKANYYFNEQQSSRRQSQQIDKINTDQIQKDIQKKFRESARHSIQLNNKFKQILKQPSQFNRQTHNYHGQNKKSQDQNMNSQFFVKKFMLNLNLSAMDGKQFLNLINNIQSINQNYFKELNQKTDQINNLQEQRTQIKHKIIKNNIKFYQSPPEMNKVQKKNIKCQKIKNQIQNTQTQAEQKVIQINKFAKTDNIKTLLNSLQFQQNVIKQLNSSLSLQQFSQIFQLVENKMNKYNMYSAPSSLNQNDISIIKTGRTQKQKKQQKLQDVINRMRVHQECDKIMVRDDFKQQYKKLLQSSGPKINSKQNIMKKKSKKSIF